MKTQTNHSFNKDKLYYDSKNNNYYYIYGYLGSTTIYLKDFMPVAEAFIKFMEFGDEKDVGIVEVKNSSRFLYEKVLVLKNPKNRPVEEFATKVEMFFQYIR